MEISVYSVSRRPAFPALFPFPFRSFNGREVSSSRASSLSSLAGKKEKSKGRKEFNIKKLSFCVDMKIPRISASFLRRLFSSLLPPHLLRVYRGSLRLLHLHLCIFIFTAADSLPGALIVWQDPPPTDK